jgi:hypothetical protein
MVYLWLNRTPIKGVTSSKIIDKKLEENYARNIYRRRVGFYSLHLTDPPNLVAGDWLHNGTDRLSCAILNWPVKGMRIIIKTIISRWALPDL